MIALYVALLGGTGAVARFVLDGFIRSKWASLVPMGTLVINVSGSLLLGVMTGLVMVGIESTDLRVLLGTGFCGGYTTFSTAMIDTVRLMQQRRWVAAFLNGAGMLVLALAAAVLGIFLGTLA
ncbi:MAG: fluoride efflux transporter CrcB [Microbacteriaceae bacterium]|nr:fluoride efflux transporter CrcB [Microbacteriaceae bacterium]MCL2794772.1 fluoride efflux transporter CrcB [Microbacteriaceae bacterium]